MCGRFTLSASVEAVREVFPLFDLAGLQPHYNIAPTQNVAAVRRGACGEEFVWLRWGLVPAWAQDKSIGHRLINARAESAADKPSFRSAFKQRRCLILADGFYEWQKSAQGKQPYRICRRDGKVFAFAGLWERWEKEDQPLESCTILTTEANELIKPLHDRMPVILGPELFGRWLDPAPRRYSEVADLLQPCAAEVLAAFPVGTYVNNPRHDDARCVAALEA